VLKPFATFNSAPQVIDEKAKADARTIASSVKVKSGAPTKLPSHRGPKIRHVTRPVVKLAKKSAEKSTSNVPKVRAFYRFFEIHIDLTPVAKAN